MRQSRRNFLIASASTAVGAAVLAACGKDENPPARIGTVPSTTAQPNAPVTDTALVRTATSLESLMIAFYDAVADQSLLTADNAEIAAKMRAQHSDHRDEFSAMTLDLGGEIYACPNERMNGIYLEPALQLILGSEQAATLGIEAPETAIPPSDQPEQDTLVLANALERIVAATHQAYMELINDRATRAQGMVVGMRSSRRGALWGALISPEELIATEASEAAVPTTTTTAATVPGETTSPTTAVAEDEAAVPAPLAHAIVAAFGSLGPVQINLGAPNDSGIRQALNIETPYLNSLAYEYLGACDAPDS